MGLLSDPSLAPRNKLGRSLAKHNRKICFLFYVAGLTWFVCLSHSDFNHGTYLSENALSPGLVYPEIKQDSSRLAQSLLDDIRREREEYKSSTPHAWLVAKMNQIGLETHVHNFTLRYPFSGGKEYHGKNVYGILRAPRIGSTEGIVFSAPYRVPNSLHPDISASVPVLLAFADFARKKNYWAKDLVFLVTEQDQLGMHAWLDAYFESSLHNNKFALKCGVLPARAGALQAAINFEIQDLDIDYINVKIEGLNGKLPNLDMFNLVQRITSREGISSGYKQTPRKKRRTSNSGLDDNLYHMAAMIMSQAKGIPNGNHGLFHRYRIEALTLEAVKRHSHNTNSRNTAALPLLKTIEGISRSLNNLLERFHQSFFFYILVQNDRFISIGDFMPCLILLACPTFIKAFLLWITVDDSNTQASSPDKSAIAAEGSHVHLPYTEVLLYIGAVVSAGMLTNLLPLNDYMRNVMATSTFSTALMLSIIFITINAVALALPPLLILPPHGLILLHIGALLLLGVALIVVGLLNFSLGFLIAIIATPLAILIETEEGEQFSLRRKIAVIYALLLNPLVAAFILVFGLTLSQFPEMAIKEVVEQAIVALMDVITFTVMDCIIYGNWFYTVITAVFFPLWALYWSLTVFRINKRHL